MKPVHQNPKEYHSQVIEKQGIVPPPPPQRSAYVGKRVGTMFLNFDGII